MNIYIYELENNKGLYKLGQTTRNVEERIKEQVGHLPIKYKILYKENIDYITDYDILKYLKEKGIVSSYRNEWFKCDYNILLEAIEICKERVKNKKRNIYVTFLWRLIVSGIKIKINLRNKKDLFYKIIFLPYFLFKQFKEVQEINKKEIIKIEKELKEDLIGLLKRRRTNILLLFIVFILLIFLFSFL